MPVTVRFAPSPTGRIHIGNARTALFNWLFALKNNGRFVQRFDDTDRERSLQEHADAILYDLHWLGIFQDQTEYQSRRLDAYAAVVERLKQSGRLYPCYETPQELDLRRKVRRTRGQPPIYGRESLKLTRAEVDEYIADGRKPHWRLLLPNFAHDPQEPERTEVRWNDLIRGEQAVDLSSVSDPVLVREDGTYLYTLTSVVDDIDFAISHVIRGDDHVTNTGVQLEIFRALGAEPPAFGHHNLLMSATGEALSKRSGALSIAGLRQDGTEAMAVASLAVLTGTSENVKAAADMNELAERFDLQATSHSAAKFDPADLAALNRTLLQGMAFADVRDRLAVLGISGERAEAFWLAVRGNLERLPQAEQWWRIVNAAPDPAPEFSPKDREFLDRAFDLLPEEPWDKTVWRRWTDALRAETPRKGKSLFLPLRLALTGRPSGPELSDLMPLMGREGILARRPAPPAEDQSPPALPVAPAA